MQELETIELFAWLGEDELGSGEIGLKRGITRAGNDVPMVSIHKEKLDRHWSQAEAQAKHYHKKIYLVRFTVAEVVKRTGFGT